MGAGGESVATATALPLDQWPEYVAHRQAIWDDLYAKYQASVAAKPRVPIKVTLPDGKEVDGKAWETTPYQVAAGISKGLADNTVIAKVNGELWDLDRPLEGDCSLVLLDFDNDEGKAVFWHSSAHVLGEAMEHMYGGCLCYGPPIADGFYYDMHIKDRTVQTADHPTLEAKCKQVAKETQRFERLEMTKEDLKRMFNYNPLKIRIIDEKIEDEVTTAYRCGPLIDLCRGPHVRHTGKIRSIAVTKSSSAYWEGNAEAETLQRVYGISFPDNKLMKQWRAMMDEAAKRDHRKIGKDQELFFFHEFSPGACFFLPHGTRIYNTLVTLIRKEYHKRGFTEVVTPNMFDSKLWEISGHWQHYKDDMFVIQQGTKDESARFGLKPMNCPGHCVVFGHRTRSWRELPIRMAEFGILHRNELTGALHGLTRVRRFIQDDAHIFCAEDQIEKEINDALDFVSYVYGLLGFTFSLKLSTRPDKFMGAPELWDRAEEQLRQCLESSQYDWTLNPGDGAFYGPKVDVTIKDALGRQHQCATIQLDFQLPLSFQLEFTGQDGQPKRPVMIHRAVLGSVERLMGVMTESFGGKWPFWLSPRQVQIVPVTPQFFDYAEKVRQAVHEKEFFVDVNTSSDTLPKKIRAAQVAQWNIVLVVGANEQEKGTVNIRTRENKQLGEMSIAECVARLEKLQDTFAPDNDLS